MISEKAAALSAVLFFSGEPVERSVLNDVLEIDESELDRLVDELETAFKSDSAFKVLTLGSRVQMSVKDSFLPYIQKMTSNRKSQPLSAAALEVLAVIAYNQPVTKSFIEQVRGVNSNSIVNSLIERGLIEEAGRLELPGRPVSYRTTDNFLRGFGLTSLSELPEIS